MAALVRRLSNKSTSVINIHCSLSPNSLSSSLLSRRSFTSRLFVGGLSFYTTEKTLAEAFSQYGQVIQAQIIHDRVSERSKGFGFVTYASEDEANKALTEMNGKQIHGRAVFVEYAKPNVFQRELPPVARGPPGNNRY